jgi:Protein of unknown function (DUF3551)
MRLSLFILGIFAAIVSIEKPARAQNGAWCAYYDTGDGGSRNCGFATFEQCLATVRGIGGNCGPSPYPSSPETLSRRPRRQTTAGSLSNCTIRRGSSLVNVRSQPRLSGPRLF